MSDRDLHLLSRARAEALRSGWLETAPNPRVGALALARGHVVGRGRHAVFGGPHAEEAALRDAGAWDEAADRPLAGVVDEVVVSLEPCSARGGEKRRPPCTETLLAAGVRRVVVGAEDPDPRHRGRGLERLRAAGVEVVVLPALGAEDREREGAALAAFQRALAAPERPFVLLKWAATLDGRVAEPRGGGRITADAARGEVHFLRRCSDAVLAGKHTLLVDDPALTARPEGRELPAEEQPLRVLLDAPADFAARARLRHRPGLRLWVHGPEGPPLEEGAADRLLAAPRDAAGRLDLDWVLRALRADFGVRRLFVEGGPRVHGALLAGGAADAVVRYEAPLLYGAGAPAVAVPPGADSEAPVCALDPTTEERADLGPDLRRAFLLR